MNDTMLALRYPAFGILEVVEEMIPAPASGEVLVEVGAVGICGSEIETFREKSIRRTPPLIMGHEFCGIVVDRHPDVNPHWIGRRVVSQAMTICGVCPSCRRGLDNLCQQRQIFGMHRDGAFARFVCVPGDALLPWPDSVAATAACLAEPLANGVHVVNLTRHFVPERVLIIGAGPIGLMCIAAFGAMTDAQIWSAELSEDRRRVAERLGAQSVSAEGEKWAEQILEITEGEGMDVVIDAVGIRVTKERSLVSLRPGGAAVWLGLGTDRMLLDTYSVTLPEKTVMGTYSATRSDLKTALQLMQSGSVDVTSWTDVFSLKEGKDVFLDLVEGNNTITKAILVP